MIYIINLVNVLNIGSILKNVNIANIVNKLGLSWAKLLLSYKANLSQLGLELEDWLS